MQTATLSPLAILGNVQLESLTISRDAMPHHFIARAVIFDVQPSQMVAAILAVETDVKHTYPRAVTTGWRAASDGLTIYFKAWQTAAQTAVA